MIKSAFIYGSYTQSKQKVFHKEPYKPDFTSLSQQQQQQLKTCAITTETPLPLSSILSSSTSSSLLSSPPPPHSNVDSNVAVNMMPSTNDNNNNNCNISSSPMRLHRHSHHKFNILQQPQQQKGNSALNTSIEDEVTDSEEEEEEDMGRVEEILSSDEGGVDSSGDDLGGEYTTTGTGFVEDYDSFDDIIGEEQEIVDSYNEKVENTRQERDKLADKMLSLFMDSEIKYNLGKFIDCYNDCVKAEEIGRHIDSHPIYIAQAVLVQAKAKFKLGETKFAQQLLQSSITIFKTFLEGENAQAANAKNSNQSEVKAWEEACTQLKSEAEALLKEVEKYASFDDGLSLVPQKPRGIGDSPTAALTRVSAPKMITRQKFESPKSKNSWQNTYLLYHRKQQGAHSACMTVKS